MLGKTLFCQLLPFCSGLAIVGIWPDADATARSENACHFDVFRIHQLNEVFHDDVDTVLMEVTVVAEAEQIKLQALALHHAHVGHIADTYLGKVGLSGDRAQRCEFWAVESYPIVITLMLVDERFENFGCVIVTIFRFCAKSLQTLVASVFIVCCFLSFINNDFTYTI